MDKGSRQRSAVSDAVSRCGDFHGSHVRRNDAGDPRGCDRGKIAKSGRHRIGRGGSSQSASRAGGVISERVTNKAIDLVTPAVQDEGFGSMQCYCDWSNRNVIEEDGNPWVNYPDISPEEAADRKRMWRIWELREGLEQSNDKINAMVDELTKEQAKKKDMEEELEKLGWKDM